MITIENTRENRIIGIVRESLHGMIVFDVGREKAAVRFETEYFILGIAFGYDYWEDGEMKYKDIPGAEGVETEE